MSSHGGKEIFHGSFAHDLAEEKPSMLAVPFRSTFALTCQTSWGTTSSSPKMPSTSRLADQSRCGDIPAYITFDSDALDP